MENIILFSFSFICWIFWLVGWLGAKGSRRTRQVPNKVEWWQCVVQVVTGGPFMPHWQLHSEGAQSFDLCSAPSIRDTGSRRTFRITQRFANIVKMKEKEKENTILTRNNYNPLTFTLYPHRTKQVCAKWHETVQSFAKWCKCCNMRPKDKQTLFVSQPSVFQSNANEEGRTRNRGH